MNSKHKETEQETTQEKTGVADIANGHKSKIKLTGLQNQLTAVNDIWPMRCYCSDLHNIPEFNSHVQES